MPNDVSVLDAAERELELRRTIKELEDEREREHKFVDLGLQGDVWYYGRRHNGFDSVVTSDRRMLVNSQVRVRDGWVGENQIGDFLHYDNTLNDFAPMMSNTAVIRLLRGESISPVKVYNMVKDKINYYMDFGEQPGLVEVLACWVMATYHYPLFSWFPNILFNCPTQSGKSKCSALVLMMAFKGFDLGASAGATPAMLFRTIDTCRGTIRLDEYEQMDADSKKLADQVLNAGVSREAYVIRNEKVGSRFVPTKFPIFCPKIACNITGINATSLNRFVVFRWLRTLSPKANLKPDNTKDVVTFKPVRDDLYLYGLQYSQKLLEAYESVAVPTAVGRATDNWKPLFAVAKVVDGVEDVGAVAGLSAYLVSYKDVDVDTNDCSEEFLQILLDVVSDTDSFYGCKQIAEWEAMKDLLGFTKSPAHWIGRKLTEYKFPPKRASGSRGYMISKQKVKDKLILYFQYNDTNSHNDTNDTNVTNDINGTLSHVISDLDDITPKQDVVVEEVPE